MTLDELVDRVVARTKGTRSDPLTRDEVEQVVTATLHALARRDAGGEGTVDAMSETPQAPPVERPDDAPLETPDPEREQGRPHPEDDPIAPDPDEERERA